MNAKNATDAKTTSSILALWPMRQLRLLRTFLRSLRALCALRWMETIMLYVRCERLLGFFSAAHALYPQSSYINPRPKWFVCSNQF